MKTDSDGGRKQCFTHSLHTHDIFLLEKSDFTDVFSELSAFLIFMSRMIRQKVVKNTKLRVDSLPDF